MPKALIRRYLPDPEKIVQMKGLGFMRHRLADPSLWQLNRRSAAGAMFWGLWCGFLPMPFQMVPAALAAIVFRVNLPLSIALVWVSNPLTLVPFIYLAYFVGSLLLGQPMPNGAELHKLVIYFSERLEGLFHDVQYTQTDMSQYLKPFLLGAVVSGFLMGCIGYIGMRLFWRWHVVREWEKRRAQRTAT